MALHSMTLGYGVAPAVLAKLTRRRHHPVPQHGAHVVNLPRARLTSVALWRKRETLLYGKRRASLALRSKDAALAFSLSRTRLRVGWVLRPMPWLNPRPSLRGVSREPPEVEALSWFSEEERGECPFCGERAVVGPAGARICLACDTPVHSAADEEE